MFKVSQEIHLDKQQSNISVSEKYQRSPGDGKYTFNEQQVFVSPEITDIKNRIQILNFPDKIIKRDENIEFIINKNDARGNVEAKMISPLNTLSRELPLQILDTDRFAVSFIANEIGMYKIYIKFNGIEIENSPLSFYVEDEQIGEKENNRKSYLPIFTSDSSLVLSRGIGLKQISLKDKNEFIINATNAGNNILFVGMFGPKGQCDEVAIKHLGKNVYNVNYRVQDRGEYLIAIKWGDDHIPNSPFNLNVS